ncbi:MAG: helix-turn-helix domain-containing protein [Candidatus Baldrarchaeia archaeon]
MSSEDQVYVVENRDGSLFSTRAKVIPDAEGIAALSNALRITILRELWKRPMCPRDLAKSLGVDERKIYYHMKVLEDAGLVKIVDVKERKGTLAKYYAPVASAFVIKIGALSEDKQIKMPMRALDEATKKLFNEYLSHQQPCAIIVVGSPDVHGPFRSQAKDGHYAAELAFFLGSLLGDSCKISIKLDTEIRTEDLTRNLILIGGPRVNTLVHRINEKIPLRFDLSRDGCIISTISGKVYYEDECGVVMKIRNPFDSDGRTSMMVLAGKRHWGTRAAILAITKRYREVVKGNFYNPSICARVVRGIDEDSDGIIDEVEFLE